MNAEYRNDALSVLFPGNAVFRLAIFFAILHHPCQAQEVYCANVTAERGNEETQATVFLTVSSLAAHPVIADRLLELNWYGVTATMEGEYSIRLYNQDPEINNTTDFLIEVDPYLYPDLNHYITTFQFPRYEFSTSNMTNECLGFWIALMKQNMIISSSCIRAFPTWMYNMRAIIRNVSLTGLVIPGTHNAGSYSYYDPLDDTIFKRYLITQEESVLNQLVFGIRYLDLRVSYERVSGSDEVFWITHGIFRTDVPLTRVIGDVKLFLKATKEIVIMDFHRFVTGFSGRRSSYRHQRLISLLENELQELMVPISLSSAVTFGEMWQANRRLYVGYASNSDRASSQFLFPAARHLWADKDNVDGLRSYLNGTICSRPRRRLTSAMAQLTPTTSGAIFDAYGGLRKMAQDVNRYLYKWLKSFWFQCANIVSTDFFLGNSVIRTAIEINKKRYYHTLNNTEDQASN